MHTPVVHHGMINFKFYKFQITDNGPIGLKSNPNKPLFESGIDKKSFNNSNQETLKLKNGFFP